MSRPREKHETGEQDLFRSRLDQIINMKHELVRLAQAIDWPVLEERFGAVYSDRPGMPPLPTPADGGLGDPQAHLRPVGRGSVRPLGGEPLLPAPVRRGVLTPRLAVRPLVADTLAPAHGRGTDAALLQESLAVAVKSGAMKPADTRRVIVDAHFAKTGQRFR